MCDGMDGCVGVHECECACVLCVRGWMCEVCVCVLCERMTVEFYTLIQNMYFQERNGNTSTNPM